MSKEEIGGENSMSVNSNVVDFNLFIDRMQEIDMILSTPGGSFL